MLGRIAGSVPVRWWWWWWSTTTIILTLNNSSRSSSLLVVDATTSFPFPGVQSHFGETTFAGGASYDPVHDALYVTGQVGPNGCYFGILELPTMQWISKQILQEPAIGMTVAVAQETIGEQVSRQRALVLAGTEEGGLFTHEREQGSLKAEQYGVLVPLIVSPNQQRTTQKTGLLMHEDKVQYPRAIVMDPDHENYAYIASMHSEDPNESLEYKQTGASNMIKPNLTPGGLLKYGSAFTLTVERVRYDPVLDVYMASWRKPFGVYSTLVGSARRPSVHVSTMIWHKGALVVVGSTKGSGDAFGEATTENETGFVTKLDPMTGKLWHLGGVEANANSRIQILEDQDTFIESVCSHGHDDDFLYVVGKTSTTANFDWTNTTRMVPFLAKLDAVTLEIEWQHTFAATNDAYGLACGVAPKSGVVYMAGVIEKDGTFLLGEGATTKSLGNDDLFVVQIKTDTGKTQWLKQLGTSGDDRLAHGKSGIFVQPEDYTSSSGGIILFGDTTGSLMANVKQSAEIFLLRVDAHGNVPDTTETSNREYKGGDLRITFPITENGDEDIDIDYPSQEGETNNNNNNNTDEIIKTNKENHRGLKLVMLTILAFVLCLVCRKRRQHQGEKSTERAVVFRYLQAFDVEEIDVTHSATGGWHGVYVGKLAKGKTRNVVPAASHSSIVKDNLFYEYDIGGSTQSSTYSKEEKYDEYDEEDQEEEDDDEEEYENTII